MREIESQAHVRMAVKLRSRLERVNTGSCTCCTDCDCCLATVTDTLHYTGDLPQRRTSHHMPYIDVKTICSCIVIGRLATLQRHKHTSISAVAAYNVEMFLYTRKPSRSQRLWIYISQ